MSGKLRLAKTRDSRTRGKAKVIEDETKVLQLKQKLKDQKDLTDYLLMKGYSTTSTHRYVKDTEFFLRWAEKQNIPHDNVSYGDLVHFIQCIKTNVTQRTVSSRLNSVKHYFNFLESTQQIEENPAKQIKLRGVKRKILYHVLSHQELESLYNNFQLTDPVSKDKNQNWYRASLLTSRRNKVILGLMIYQGLNSHELGELTKKDVKLKEGKVYVPGGRKSNERTLPLEAHQVMDMMEYILTTREQLLQLANKQSEKLFVSYGVSDHFRSIASKLIKKLHSQNPQVTSVKQIRASVITHWLKLYNLRQVQYMAGHRFVSSTEYYLINDLDDLQEDIQRYHPIE